MADVVVDADNKNPEELLGQGVRAYALQDYAAAVAALSKASELLVQKHGDDLHESLGEVYLYYGKALLGVSREEAEPLGDAVPKGAEDESDDEEEMEAEEIEEKQENGEGSEKTSEESKEKISENAEAAVSEKASTAPTSEDATAGSSTDASAGPSADSKENGENVEEADDEPTDLQVAWEVLELAKKIYQKQGEAGKKNLAETLIVLGEISLESENFEAAVNDIKEGLEIQKQIFAKDSRTVAETCYKLGIAYSTNTQIDEAIESFKNSMQYLKTRIENLESQENKKDGVEEEIEEIRALIPDIEEKITDMKSYMDEAMKKIKSAISSPSVVKPGESSSSSSSKPATNISHLVKRKRKLEDIVEEPDESGSSTANVENPSKKTATDSKP